MQGASMFLPAALRLARDFIANSRTDISAWHYDDGGTCIGINMVLLDACAEKNIPKWRLFNSSKAGSYWS
jgi:hypothetical protein